MVRREVSYRSPVVSVRPEVLDRNVSIAVNEQGQKNLEPTRTEYCLPARIQGDSVRLKNMVAGSSKVLIYCSSAKRR